MTYNESKEVQVIYAAFTWMPTFVDVSTQSFQADNSIHHNTHALIWQFSFFSSPPVYLSQNLKKKHDGKDFL